MKRNQSGFTLIEIAIVLVIIGLLLGGILKGQELINSAKVKNLATDFRNIPVFMYGYQDKYKALPGDDKNVISHLGSTYCAAAAAAATPCQPGDGNGLLGTPSATIGGDNWTGATWSDETQQFWIQVRLAGLAPGTTTGTAATDFRPTNASGGSIGIQSGTSTAANSPILDKNGNAISGSYVICSESILGKYVKQLDTTMDDGETDTGSMLATPTSGYAFGTTATATASINDATTYTVCMGV